MFNGSNDALVAPPGSPAPCMRAGAPPGLAHFRCRLGPPPGPAPPTGTNTAPSLHPTCRRELSEAYEWLVKYRASRKDPELHQAWDLYYHVFKRINKQLHSLTTLELQYVAPALVRAQGMELAVPGTYIAGGRRAGGCDSGGGVGGRAWSWAGPWRVLGRRGGSAHACVRTRTLV
jgi:hypothetical protein